MKTYLITNSGIVEDSRQARTEEFNFLSRWTGDEWTADCREKFATRSVWFNEPDPEDPCQGDDKHYIVEYSDRETDSMESITVARYATEAEAEAFAEKENKRLLGEFLGGDWHHIQIDLPDGWEAYIGGVEQGKYPQSRKVSCTLHGPDGLSVEDYARWDSNGVTNTWLRGDVVKQTLVDMIADLLAEAITKATEEVEIE